MAPSPPPATIMIIDDTPANLRLLQELLQQKGYRTVAFPSGVQALRVVAKNPPDLILLDILMPEMNGFDVCRQIKADRRLQDIPIIFISALTATADKVQAFTLGGVDYITKPFQPEEIYARVATQLRLRRLLQASERRQQVLIEELPDIVMRFDRAGHHLFVSRKIAGIGNLAADAYMGRSHADLSVTLGLAPEYCRFWEKAIEEVFRRGRPFETEYSPAGCDPPQIHNLRLVPEYNADGQIESVLALSRDITRSKQAENALIQAREAAEAARKAAEASERAKTEFLTNMSHEIRTPLNGIIGMLSLLQDGSLNADQDENVLLAINAADALTGLLTRILDLADLEFGRLTLHPAQFGIVQLLNTLTDLFTPRALEKDIDLVIKIAPETPLYLIGDAPRVQQILFNLVGNALKFTSAGSVRLSVTPLPFATPNTVRLLFTIEDSGIGISEEQLEYIWQPFRQGDGSLTRPYEGAGLGLTLVRRLVDLMGGNMALDTSPEAGTSVYLVLPFGKV